MQATLELPSAPSNRALPRGYPLPVPPRPHGSATGRLAARKGRAALIWGIVAFAGIQLGLSIRMDRQQPELRDPEYGYKLIRLNSLRAQAPDRPLQLVLGSSRSGMGFSGKVFEEYAEGDTAVPLTFNFSMTGGGPMLELMTLKRVLRAGIRPDRVIIEILPPLLNDMGPLGEAVMLNINRLGWDDLAVIEQYTGLPHYQQRNWLRSRMTPWYSHRFCIMSRYAPGWLEWAARMDGWAELDDHGWLPSRKKSVTPEEYRLGVDRAKKEYAEPLKSYRISEKANKTLHELLELCRRENIQTMLLLMPEGSEFQTWYPAGAKETVGRYVAELGREYDIPVSDCRDWMDDAAFWDNHHLLPSGAKAFTRRFVREIYLPYLKRGTARLANNE
jgi:hypothetical protein